MGTPLQIFGNTIRDLRKQKGLSQEKLADLCNIHRTYMGSVERGERNLSLMNILLLAKGLDVLPGDLFRDFDKSTINRLGEWKP